MSSSLDGSTWAWTEGQKVYTGNRDNNSIVKHTLATPISAKFLRFYPTEKNNKYALRVEIYGNPQGCTEPLGMEKNAIPSARISSSSYQNTANQGRLYGSSSWCSRTIQTSEYLKVDLGQVKTIAGIATQGCPSSNNWVTTYTVSYSYDNERWIDYKDESSIKKSFAGNVNNNDVKVNWFKIPVAARYMRIHPTAQNNANCVRMELFGCASSLVPSLDDIDAKTLQASPGSSVSITCVARGYGTQIKLEWFLGSTDVTASSQIINRVASYARSSLTVKYTSVEQVLSNFACQEPSANSRDRPCTVNYTCYASYDKLPGGGMAKSRAQVTTTLRLPAKPVFKKPLTNVTSITLVWETMAPGDGEGTITTYKIFFVNGSVTKEINTQSNTTTYRLTNLKPFTGYSAKVRAVSRIGTGFWSDEQIFTTGGKALNVPSNITTVHQGPNIIISWNELPPDDRNGKIIAYEISWMFQGNRRTRRSVVSSSVNATSSPYVLRLRLCSIFSLTMKAYTSGGPTPASKPIKLQTPVLIPGQPSQLVASVQKSDVLLTWKNPDTKDSGVKYIKVLYNGSQSADNSFEISGSRNISEKVNSYNVTGLVPSTEYVFAVVIVNECGEGAASNTASGKTLAVGVENKKPVENTYDGLIAVWVLIPLILIVLIVLAILYIRRRSPLRRQKKSDKGSVELERRSNLNGVPVEDFDIIGDRDGSPGETNQASDSSIYSEPVNAERTGPIPVGEFSDFVTRAKQNDSALLRNEFQHLQKAKQFSWNDGKLAENKEKNRYANILPYDHARVVLKKIDGSERSDYINASYIRGFDGTAKHYIATQGPIPETLNDFWRMLWQENSSIVVMVTGLTENEKTKCHKYWPEQTQMYGAISVSLHKCEIFSDYTKRTFILSKVISSEQRYVYQYHFTAWPDKGVPQYATAVLGFRKKIVSDMSKASNRAPWVVHCSAGVGRTGAFITIDAMLRQAKEWKVVGIYNYIQSIRQDRPHMIQTSDQYVFVYLALRESLVCGSTEISAHNLGVQMTKLAKIKKPENMTRYAVEMQRLSFIVPDVTPPEETRNGLMSCNFSKNRFSHVLPIDARRVILAVDKEEAGADYINASYVNAYRERDAFILTQAPLENTIADFWRMIYEKGLGTIVMLNNLEEEEEEFPQYWPSDGAELYGQIKVHLIEEDQGKFFTSRKFLISHESDVKTSARDVRHYQYTAWRDHSVPPDENSIIDLVNKTQYSQQQSGNEAIVIQCSDGVGRSGTFCAVLSVLERVKQEQIVDVFQSAKILRISRPRAVETLEQYMFCYKVILAYLDSFSDYANFTDS